MSKTLLGTNRKLSQPVGNDRWLIRGLSLAPNILSGHNVCPFATAGCIAACVLWFAGRTNSASVRARMIERTRMWFDDRRAFELQLGRELEKLCRDAEAKNARPACRLNVASDILWERKLPWVFKAFAPVAFYDYTKYPASKRRETPPNYHLTHSVSERTSLADVQAAFALGRNVCIVFDADYRPSVSQFGELPDRLLIMRGGSIEGAQHAMCVDGDRHDLRIPAYDSRRCVVALRGKGGAARVADAMRAGFIQEIRHCRWSHADKRLGDWATTVHLN